MNTAWGQALLVIGVIVAIGGAFYGLVMGMHALGIRNMRRGMKDYFEPQERFGGLTEHDLDTLGRYNAERAHGIAHTPEWDEKMAGLQARFDAAERERIAQWGDSTVIPSGD